ncbi:hypothetical protein F5X99DRAFT_417060 [Biscogniauxia marginata]|nr:hypothetical protein F5X99DRAFT_417060 [Biscogniauxia marginata]
MSSRRYRDRNRRSSSPSDRGPTHARQRDYPPGPSDENRDQRSDFDLRAPTRPRRRRPSVVDEDDYLDFEWDSNDEYDPIIYVDDDPPLSLGTRNRTTVGVELEFIVAGSQRYDTDGDPHPNDGRWLSRNLIAFDDDSSEFYYTVRNKIIDEMRAHGIVAVKTNLGFIISAHETFHYWDSVDDTAGAENDLALESWTGSYTWDPTMNSLGNIQEAIDTLGLQFRNYHKDHNLPFHKTQSSTIEDITPKIPGFLENFSEADKGVVAAEWRLLALSDTETAATDLRWTEETEVDPNCVNIQGRNSTYDHWTCDYDCTVTLVESDPENWEIPDDSLPRRVCHPGTANYPTGTIIPVGDLTPPEVEQLIVQHREPPDPYKWYGAEVISPVLDFDHPETIQSLRSVCASIRNSMRVHKPFSAVGNGFHVHFGQEAGWTLLHLKRFATLWTMLEEELYSLHCLGRETVAWCKPMNRESQIADALAGRIDQDILSGTRPPVMTDYIRTMERHVPSASIDAHRRAIIQEIWLYQSINGLREGLTPRRFSGHILNVRWRVYGEKRSTAPEPCITQTLEIRMMQGTLDAEHIR